jgi:uncharacterized protein (DUF427 family)
VQLGGSYIFDSTSAALVWEHPYFPQYYLPKTSLKNASLSGGRKVGEGKTAVTIYDVIVNGTAFDDAVMSVESGPLEGFLRPDAFKMEAWFEEDDPIRGHPTDPYKRIDVRRSSRPIKVGVSGEIVAEATWAVHLYETGLPVRYYLPRTALKPGILRESETSFYCPYKGTSKYYDVNPKPGAEPVKDIVWYYDTAMVAVEAIHDLVRRSNLCLTRS